MKELKAWVARDENGDIFLFLSHPKRYQSEWLPECNSGLIELIELRRESFPEVKWEDEEPTELTFTIKK